MSTIKTDTLQNVAGTLTVPVGTVVNGSAKAWVNFNGTGTVAIRAAFNVSSITDNGTGDYTINFTTALADANYSVSACTQRGMSNSGLFGSVKWDSTMVSSNVRIAVVDTGVNSFDATGVFVSIFR